MTLKVVLVEPKIPPNTGNIARTCAATGTQLHLVGPLGFEISDRHLKRAGLDYWPHVDLHQHESLDEFLAFSLKAGGRLLGYSVRGNHSYRQYQYHQGDWLLFGSETEGLSSKALQFCEDTLYIPIDTRKVRSLNLSVSVAIGLFEAKRQLDY